MAWPVGVLAYLVSAVAMFVVAIWLVAFKASPRNRAFALVLILRALFYIFDRVGSQLESRSGAILQSVASQAKLSEAFALAWFVVLLMDARPRTWVPGLFVLGAAGANLIYMANPCTDFCADANGGYQVGWLFLVSMSVAPLLGVAGLAMAFQAHTPRAWPPETAWLVAAGIALNGLMDGAISWLNLAIGGLDAMRLGNTPGVFYEAGYLVWMTALPLAAAAMIWLATTAHHGLDRGAWIWGLSYGVVLVGLTAFFIVTDYTHYPIGLFLGALLRGVLPACIAYGLIRHRLPASENRAQQTVRRGVVGAALMAVFFAASEAAATWSGELLNSTYLGIATTASMMFFLAPLSRFGDRVAGKMTRGGNRENDALYEHQVRIIWSDGVMGIKERRLLDSLQQSLQLPPDRAMAIENRVTSAA